MENDFNMSECCSHTTNDPQMMYNRTFMEYDGAFFFVFDLKYRYVHTHLSNLPKSAICIVSVLCFFIFHTL